MIWRRKDKAQDHFVTFDHQEQRIAALESDLREMTKDLLAYLEADIACGWMVSAKRLAETLRKIIGRREGAGSAEK